jgi:hypothetical protein
LFRLLTCFFCMDLKSKEENPGPCTYKVSALPTELYLQPLFYIFKECKTANIQKIKKNIQQKPQVADKIFTMWPFMESLPLPGIDCNFLYIMIYVLSTLIYLAYYRLSRSIVKYLLSHWKIMWYLLEWGTYVKPGTNELAIWKTFSSVNISTLKDEIRT